MQSDLLPLILTYEHMERFEESYTMQNKDQEFSQLFLFVYIMKYNYTISPFFLLFHTRLSVPPQIHVYIPKYNLHSQYVTCICVYVFSRLIFGPK